MRFSNASNVDVKTWKGQKVKMEKEGGGLVKDGKPGAGDSSSQEIPKFGAGSEFGRAEREEARIKKYTPRGRKNLDSAPWLLKIGSGKTSKRYRGVREGGVDQNASLYIFFQAVDGAFEAVPVNEWYKFNLQAKYKALTAEEAEERFEKRDKIMNFFSVMKSKGEDSSTGLDSFDSKPKKKTRDSKSFKVTDMDEWADSDADDDSGPDVGSDDEVGKKGKKGKKKGKKGSDVDSEAGEESDEGDFDTREMDYISSSSDDDDEEDLDERLNRDLKGVEDEEGLKGLVISDDSDEEEDGEKDKDPSKADDLIDSNSRGGEDGIKDKKNRKRMTKDGEISDESVSGSDDSEIDDDEVDKSKSWMFMQARPEFSTSNSKNGKLPASTMQSGNNSNSNSRSETPVKEVDGKSDVDGSTFSPVASGSSIADTLDNKSALKRKLETTPSASPAAPKKAKTAGDDDGVSEEAVRRYLLRKPMTAKELFKKFKTKLKGKGTGETIAHQIAGILKKINPEKQTRNGELYLSLKSNAK
jgi:transcription initiation factor TFIIF subunit alpha